MKAYLHDDTPSTPHGFRGPTHAGTLTVDCEYQLLMWLEVIGREYPKIVRIETDDGREWRRHGQRFEAEK